MPAKKNPAKGKLNYEEAFAELEEITQRLENDPACLEALLNDFERGQELITFCQNTLKATRKKLELIEAQINNHDSPVSELDTNQSTNPTSYDDVRLI